VAVTFFPSFTVVTSNTLLLMFWNCHQVTLISAISALLGILPPFATRWPVCPGTDFNVLLSFVLKMSWSLALVE
jgi:hypothetical protein